MSCVQEDPNTQDLVRGYVELFHHSLCHVKSMVFGCAVQLGIPSAIHRRGGAATISDIVNDTGINPSKLPYLRRLMRVLTVSGIFATAGEPSSCIGVADTGGESDTTVYKLTPASRLLVSSDGASTSRDMSQFMHILVRPPTVTDFFHLEEWFKDAGDATLFEMVHGMHPFSLAKIDASYNKIINEACAADSSFVMDTFLNKSHAASHIFSGINSIVDVGGGYGAVAVAIARAFPHIQCSVLDLEQVVRNAPADAHGTVKFIAGDMFQSIPAADCVLLKMILHCWDDDKCVQILRQCKRAIPARDVGGKVIIMNMVVGHGTPDMVTKEVQLMFDVYMMRNLGGEREEHEWRRIFLEAGFSDYRITPLLSFQSIIEVFP